MSGNTPDAAQHVQHGSNPYRLIDGTPVANNRGDLLDGTLAHPIDMTAAGTLPPCGVRTSTGADGTATNSATCSGAMSRPVRDRGY